MNPQSRAVPLHPRRPVSHQLQAPFSFLNLPRELRDRVYRQLLCVFDDELVTIHTREFHQLERMQHSVEPAILRTNKQVHKEAYNVMVRTNRFIRIEAKQGVILRLLLNSNPMPVISSHSRHVNSLKDYVLQVSLSRVTTQSESRQDNLAAAPCSVMLLARQLVYLCKCLADGDIHQRGFSEGLHMTFKMRPKVGNALSSFKGGALDDFFTERIQESLLKPFSSLRSIKNVSIGGNVLKERDTIQDWVEEERLSE